MTEQTITTDAVDRARELHAEKAKRLAGSAL